MSKSMGHPVPATIPWTNGERTAYLALVEHCQGTEDTPACATCRTPEPGECETGARLRSAVGRATTSRIGQAART